MVRLSDIVIAAEQADQSRLEKALCVLRGEDASEPMITATEAAEACRCHVMTIYRRCVPAETLAGKNWYRLSDVKNALRGAA